jgi:class 3 adenylate cyclase/CheY-like chemotaxis protein
MSILIVDDSRMQRKGLSLMLAEAGYRNVILSPSGEDALDQLAQPSSQIELILTDLDMPGLTGIEVCQRVKATPGMEDLPIIVITGSDEVEDLHLAFSAGAMDYITKPPNKLELVARVSSALKLKHEMDARKARERELIVLNQRLELMFNELAEKHADLQSEKEKSERLLLNVLPRPIAQRLKSQPEQQVIADYFDEATVLFADIVNFSALSADITAEELVSLLNEFFSLCDQLAEKYGLEKIKTIGDAYMAVAGIPQSRPDHAEAAADMALAIRDEISHIANGKLTVRIGLHTGPVVAGVIGAKKFSYDLWGATVNVASRMEAYGVAGSIQTTTATFEQLKDCYQFEERGMISIKNLGQMQTYILTQRKS